MKKSEMEIHQVEYHTRMAQAREARAQGFYRKAIEFALSSWDYIDGMMQYERKYENKEFDNVEAIEMVLKYSPVLLDFSSLDALETLLNSQRRIEKHTSDDLAENLIKARKVMWDVHRLWDYLEQNPETRQDTLRQVLGGDQDQWRWIAETWGKMGLLRRTPEGGSYCLTLLTRLGEVVSGKCPACSSVAEAPKAMFLEELVCPDCKKKVLFVILSKEAKAEMKE